MEVLGLPVRLRARRDEWRGVALIELCNEQGIVFHSVRLSESQELQTRRCSDEELQAAMQSWLTASLG